MGIRAVVFDLGGVVVDYDFSHALTVWQEASRLAPAALRDAFRFDDPYGQLELGTLDANAYFAHLQRALCLDCGHDVIERGWNAIFQGRIDATLALIDGIRGAVPCHALSNTNALHLDEIRRLYPDLLTRFEQVFASHEIGARKPQPEAFHHVLRAIGVPAHEVLFFDDRQDNVEAAIACGLQGVVVRQPGDVRDALLAHGLLTA
jgi:putative hydrolase of the HAD superfamily